MPTQQEAQDAAQAAWQQLQHQGTTLLLQLSEAVPELIAEQPVRVEGFKAEIDALNWVANVVTHSVEGGYGQFLELVVG